MKLLSIGCGYIGSVLAEEIVHSLDFEKLIICDSTKEKVEETAKKLGEKIFPLQLDISNYSNLLEIIDDVDLVIGLSPGKLGFNVMRACIEKKKNLVDLSFMAEDPFLFQEQAIKEGITIIPDCGVAPGLSSILIGKSTSELDEVEDALTYVGGLPQKAIPPLNYKITWCVEDLFEEYTRKAKIVRNGKTVEVDALEGLEEIEFEGLGKFEAFFTDGVRTLHHTIRANNMWEKTLRYPGHAEKIKLIKKLGLLKKEPVKSIGMSPWEFMCRFWEENLSFFEEKDFVLMRTKVSGKKNSTKFMHTCEMIDYFDEKRNITAMGRTTAYTAFAVIKLLHENEIERKGVIPPEILGMDKKIFEEIKHTLEEKKIKIKQRIERI
ncbi:MAG: saccharopine dehydrogenase NADP-binding domain-containing protein [Candidatus Bathyarchaeota archaeon]|nr:saccharopine dehydrogenase NADP-binding domain-containing protein [Candidatus Bathyarchaeota archaeon]